MKIKKLINTTLAFAATALLTAVPVSADYGTVTADLLTVRSAPSVESDAVGMLSWGDTVTITYEPGNGWYEIYLDDCCYYVSSEFVTCDDSSIAAAAQNYYTEYGTYDYDSYDTEDAYEVDNSAASVSEEDPYANATYLGNFTLTAYCGCAACCGSAGNLTASGTVPTAGRTVAMGGVDFGTKLLINGHVYTVEDRGTSYGMVDIFCNSHSDAIAFGMQSADVYLVP